MKRILIICFISLWTVNATFSQNIRYPKKADSLIVITPEQLRVTNLIFLEHEKLLKTDSLYQLQIKDMQSVIDTYSRVDSIQKTKIESCLSTIDDYDKQVTKLTKDNKKLSKLSKLKSWMIGGFCILTVTMLIIR